MRRRGWAGERIHNARDSTDSPSGRLNRIGSRGLNGRRGRGRGRVYDVFQLFTGLEIRDLLGRNFHARAGLRVATHARLPLPGAEAAKAANLNLVTATQR